MTKPSTDGNRDPLEVLAESFLARWRAGERPNLSEIAAQYPENQTEIEELLKVLIELEVNAATEPLAQSPRFNRQDSGLPSSTIGDYRVLREIARGGMGIVYEAEHTSLGRHVAVKVLPAASLTDRSAVERFQREARAAAQLHHPHIVPVFDVGEGHGLHYYVMQYIHGQGIDLVLAELRRSSNAQETPSPIVWDRHQVQRRLFAISSAHKLTAATTDPTPSPAPDATSGRPASHTSSTARRSTDRHSTDRSSRNSYYRSMARICLQAADAIAYAHGQGILHRDIKPSNLLLDVHGQVWLTDFGLAKFSELQGLTETGDVVGTLRYMAPERIDGWSDPRSDVYSLGATLYEFLTLQPIHSAHDRAELLQQILHQQPIAPRRIQSNIPLDLETITLKATAKEPNARYATAEQMAEDLRRYLDDRPILARRSSTSERFVRWCRRNPALATTSLLALVGSLVTIGVLLSSNQAIRQSNLDLQSAVTERDQAIKGQRTALGTAQTQAERAELYARSMAVDRGILAGDQQDYSRAVLWFAEAARLSDEQPEEKQNNLMRLASHSLLGPQRLAILEHPFSEQGRVNKLTFSPQSDQLMSRVDSLDYRNSEVRVWDLPSWREIALLPAEQKRPTAAAWSGNGERLLCGTERGQVYVFTLPLVGPSPPPPVATMKLDRSVTEVAISQSGRLLAAATMSELTVWRFDAKAELLGTYQLPEQVYSMDIASTDQHLLITTIEGSTQLFNLSSGKLLAPELVLDYSISPIRNNWINPSLRSQFLRDGRSFTWHAGGGNLQRTELVSVDGTRRDMLVRGLQNSFAISPDENLVLYGGIANVTRLADRLGTDLGYIPHRINQSVQELIFHPSAAVGMDLAQDRLLRLFTIPELKPIAAPLEHSNQPTALAASPNGVYLASAELGAAIHVWALDAHKMYYSEIRVPTQPSLSSTNGIVSADGALLLPTGRTGNNPDLTTTQVYDVATTRATGVPLSVADGICTGSFVPGTPHVVLATELASARTAGNWSVFSTQGNLHLFNWKTGELIQRRSLNSPPRAVKMHPQRRELSLLTLNGRITRYHADTLEQIDAWQAHPPASRTNWYIHNGMLNYSPDGRLLVSYGLDNVAHVWDTETAREKFKVQHEGRVDGVAFSRDGKLLATSGWSSNGVRVVDVETGEPLAPDLSHPDWPFSIDFSPDGNSLVTSCRDGYVRNWDWRTGQVIGRPLDHSHETHDARFIHRGEWILTSCDDGTARIWEAKSGQALTPRLPLNSHARTLLLSIHVTPDQSTALITGTGSFYKIPLQPEQWVPNSSSDEQVFAEFVSGKRQSIGGEIRLSQREWIDRYQSLVAHKSPWLHRPTTADVTQYLKEDTETAMRNLDWPRLLWGLNQRLQLGDRAAVLQFLLQWNNNWRAGTAVTTDERERNFSRRAIRQMMADCVSAELLEQPEFRDNNTLQRTLFLELMCLPTLTAAQADTVLSMLNGLLTRNPELLETANWLQGAALVRAGQLDQGLKILQSAASMEDPPVDVAAFEALAWAKKGELDRAAEVVRLGYAWAANVFLPTDDSAWEVLAEVAEIVGPDRVLPAAPLDKLVSIELLRRYFPGGTNDAGDDTAPSLFGLIVGQHWAELEAGCRKRVFPASVTPTDQDQTTSAQDADALVAYVFSYLATALLAQDKIADYHEVVRRLYDEHLVHLSLINSWHVWCLVPEAKLTVAEWQVVSDKLLRGATPGEASTDTTLQQAFILLRQQKYQEALDLFVACSQEYTKLDERRLYHSSALATLGQTLALAELGRSVDARAKYAELNSTQPAPWNDIPRPGSRVYDTTLRVVCIKLVEEIEQKLQPRGSATQSQPQP